MLSTHERRSKFRQYYRIILLKICMASVQLDSVQKSKSKHNFFSWRHSMYVVRTPSNAHNTYQHDGSTKVFRIGQWQLIQCLVVRVISKVAIIQVVNKCHKGTTAFTKLHYKYLIHQHKKLHIST